MMKKIKFYFNVVKLILQGRWAGEKELKVGYDFASQTYDDLWGKKTFPHDLYLIDKLKLKDSDKVLDLACGTGLVSLEIARRLKSGWVYGIDLSWNMLKVAEEKARKSGIKNVSFEQADMLNKIRELPDEGFDVVTCCWALGYSEPIALLQQVRRVVKRGGQIGIIANVNNSPKEAYDVFLEVIQRHPDWIASIIRIKFPRDKDELERMFISAGLDVLETWEDGIVKICPNGKEVLDWMLKTGAGAVFADTLVEEYRDKLLAEFSQEVERLKTSQGIKIVHRFVAGIAVRK